MSFPDQERLRWWHPARLQARQENLRIRAAARQAIAGVFKEGGFIEVETPALQLSPGLEPHLVAFKTALVVPGNDEESGTRYLHTSPEFAMKKLLAGGMDRIWQLARVFRNAEGSPTHHPEFTMLEWYRVDGGYRDLIDDCVNVFRAVSKETGQPLFRHGSVECDPSKPPEILTVAEVFERYCGIDLPATYRSSPLQPPAEPLAEKARELGIRVAQDDRWDDVFFRVFSERIEPNLGIGAPTFLVDYPISMAALSRPKPDNPMLAERVEVYICGVELANGFGELTDAGEQRSRFETDMALKQTLYGYQYPIDEGFIQAVGEMPEAAGMALGFDRLVMLLTGVSDIREVLWSWVE